MPSLSSMWGDGMNNNKTVYVVDDDDGARESLRWLLESVRLRVVTFASGEAFLQSFNDESNCCLVIDLRMPGLGGLAVIEQLAAREISPPVIIVTAYGTVSLTVRAMRAGAVHVLEKPYDNQELLDAVQDALRRDEVRRAEYAQRVAIHNRLALLTPREREVLDLIVAGKSNKMMAHALHVSEKNIEYHRANIYHKMQAENLAALVLMVGDGRAPKIP